MLHSSSRIVPGSKEATGRFGEVESIASIDSITEQMMYTDFVTYLPDDILTKVDRASMAHGLEARVPLLDHEVVQAAWAINSDYRSARSAPKKLLKNVLYQYLGESMFDRPKKGFSAPINDWLRGPLKIWAENLLTEQAACPAIDTHELEKCWRAFLLGHDNQTNTVWNALVFLSWYAVWCND